MPRLTVRVEDVQQLPKTYEKTIPEDYLDEMGHMNVMWYTHLFSYGMGSLFECFGMSWEEIGKIDGGTFALESHVRYLSEVRVGQSVEVHSRLVARSAKRFHVVHFMVNLEKQDVSAVFETVGAYVNLKERRMAEIPEVISARMDEMIQTNSQLDWEPPLCGIMAP